ncbi:AraC family transcriptional regulator [Oleiphilus messinensis]|uniref:AraC family transcriptional regulator n=1 Tax=Oleiphilus messinensis TaxID=141451 RepID=A0A1Y0I9D7_9GAMM|nr:AraC family transcriptional regulator [Oleiphilus messinensis]
MPLINAAESLTDEIEALKQQAIELNRDLFILEEDLLFPATTQVAIFVSLDVGYFFQLDAVEVEIDGRTVASHLYTERQAAALSKGGLQRIYAGNLKKGEHELTAVFVGVGPNGRDYRRAVTTRFQKSEDPAHLELTIRDSAALQQPEFRVRQW